MLYLQQVLVEAAPFLNLSFFEGLISSLHLDISCNPFPFSFPWDKNMKIVKIKMKVTIYLSCKEALLAKKGYNVQHKNSLALKR